MCEKITKMNVLHMWAIERGHIGFCMGTYRKDCNYAICGQDCLKFFEEEMTSIQIKDVKVV